MYEYIMDNIMLNIFLRLCEFIEKYNLTAYIVM